MTNSGATPEESLRQHARSLAERLHRGGISPQEVTTTTEREEQQSTGFLGMKKKTVIVPETRHQPLGWKLWAQTTADALYVTGLSGVSRPVNHVSKELQLWLREDGELVAVEFDRDHVILANRQVENMTIRVATDSELRYPDFAWNERDEAGTPNPSVEYKKYWVADTTNPIHATPCGGLEASVLSLDRSAP
jgi:hypothetical protein